MQSLIVSRELPDGSLTFDVGVGCGRFFQDIARVLEPESSNPCIELPKPLGFDAVERIIKMVRERKKGN